MSATYVPRHGDLVFFEQTPKHSDGMVARLDLPNGRLLVSHVGLVDMSSAEPNVVENALTPSPEVGVQELAKVCMAKPSHPRRLLIVRSPGGRVGAVDEGKKLIHRSEYSIDLLQLGVLAGVLRQLPCSGRRTRVWDLVHRVAREVIARVPQGRYAGTCASTVAEMEARGSNDLSILEPPCPHPAIGEMYARHVRAVVLIAREAAVRKLDELADGPPSADLALFFTLDGEIEGLLDVIGQPDDVLLDFTVGTRIAAYVQLAEQVIADALPQGAGRFGESLNRLRNIAEEVAGRDDGGVTPQPGEKAYLPLVSPGLVLYQSHLPSTGPYDAYV